MGFPHDLACVHAMIWFVYTLQSGMCICDDLVDPLPILPLKVNSVLSPVVSSKFTKIYILLHTYVLLHHFDIVLCLKEHLCLYTTMPHAQPHGSLSCYHPIVGCHRNYCFLWKKVAYSIEVYFSRFAMFYLCQCILTGFTLKKM